MGVDDSLFPEKFILPEGLQQVLACQYPASVEQQLPQDFKFPRGGKVDAFSPLRMSCSRLSPGSGPYG